MNRFCLEIACFALASVSQIAYADPDLEQLIRDLRDDDIQFNADRAAESLMRHPISPVARLYEALNDDDWQARQIACDLLWTIRITQESQTDSSNGMYRTTRWRWRLQPTDPSWRFSERPPVTRRLIEVTLEGLRDDSTPYDRPRGRALMYTNAVHGFYRMIDVAHDWVPELRSSIESDDPQARYFAAMIAARAGVLDLIEPACAILFPQLRDNDVPEDAKYAVWALHGFGEALIPFIHSALPDADTQQNELLSLLMLDIKDPPQDDAEKERHGRRYNSITRIVYDPVLDAPKGQGWWWAKYIKVE